MFDRVEFASDPSAESVFDVASKLSSSSAPSALIVLLAVGRDYDLAKLSRLLARLNVPIVGGVFPGLVRDRELLPEGAAVLSIAAPSRAVVIHEFSAPRGVLERSVRSLLLASDASRLHTALVLVDGFAGPEASPFFELLHTHFHAGVESIGGGSGFKDFVRAPSLFTESGVLPIGSGVALRIDRSVAVRLAHGWESMAGPFFASDCSGGTVATLDWRPAVDVYEEAIGRIVDRDQGFLELGKLHPLAVVKLKNNLVVRDPIAVTDSGGLVTLGEIPKHSIVRILKSNPDRLIEAAESAAREARSLVPEPARAFVADCVSRADALGSRFSEELRRVHESLRVPVVGALTVGEIASSGDLLVELHNKTIVVGVS
ncbi:MAG: FIST C-terminal domain-containing protein [Deltaproteobacteria bacterium]|nr:FIST C-terminal domain-containing protein [Deltaproteobacteria bacterium]